MAPQSGVCEGWRLGTWAGTCGFSSGLELRPGGLLRTQGAWIYPPLVCVPEMAERHNTKQILKLARDLVYKVQTLIENK